MAKDVYFIRRLATGTNYSYAGFTLAIDPSKGHRKVLKDWMNEKGSGIVEPGEAVAIKNHTQKGRWATFSVGQNGTVRLVGWSPR